MSAPPPRDGPPTPPPSTAGMVREVREGDVERLRELYERLAPAIHAWADLRIPARIRTMMEPQDVVQEVWCRALRRFASFDPGRSPFRAWVFKIATYVLLEGLRKAGPPRAEPAAGGTGSKVFGLSGVAEPATSISLRAARHEGLEALLAAVAWLDPVEKRILVYHGLEGLPHAEVARRVGLGTDAAMKRWQRLRQKLADQKAWSDLISED